jgi:hypothetical protein
VAPVVVQKVLPGKREGSQPFGAAPEAQAESGAAVRTGLQVAAAILLALPSHLAFPPAERPEGLPEMQGGDGQYRRSREEEEKNMIHNDDADIQVKTIRGQDREKSVALLELYRGGYSIQHVQFVWNDDINEPVLCVIASKGIDEDEEGELE